MASEIIKDFNKYLGQSPSYNFRGPLSPLMCGCPWTTNHADPFLVLFISKGRDGFFAVSEDRYYGAARQMFGRYMKHEITLANLRTDHDSIYTEMENLYAEIITLPLEKENITNLTRWMNQANDLLGKMIDHTVYIETFDLPIVTSILDKDKESFVSELWEKATHPAFISFDGRRLKYILDKIEKVDNKNDLGGIVQEVKYIYTDYASTKNDKEIIELLKDIFDHKQDKTAELEKSQEEFEKNLSDYSNWAATLNTEQKYFIEYVQFVMKERDNRKDPIAKVQAVFQYVGEEILARAGLPKELVHATTPDELGKGPEYLEQNKDVILRRKDGFIGLINDQGLAKSESRDFDSLLQEFDDVIVKKQTQNQTLKGQIACRGKVTGVVRIVLDPHDDKGFKQGDILVTSMTRPEFVPLMKQAAAIITNEGGITCHAAIVSRELKIPCIIGTKVATRVLKDGDMVEVDADNGVVRIIK